MIGGLPESTAEAIGHDILVAALVWLGAIMATAVAAVLLGIMAWKAPSRNIAYAAGAITCGVLSIGLLVLLLNVIGSA